MLAVAIRRIAFGDGVGGMERAAAQHVASMVDLGYRVTLYTRAGNHLGTVPPGVQVVDVPWPAWDKYRFLSTYGLAYYLWTKRLARALEKDSASIDFLHLHGGAAGALRVRSLRDHKVPSLVNPHGMEAFGKFSLVRVPNRIFLRRLLQSAQFADRAVATDSILEESTARNCRVPRDRVVTIPNSVDVDALTALVDGTIAPDQFTIVSIGRMVPNKGYDLLVGALSREDVRGALPDDYRWVHFGSGPERERIESAAQQRGIPLEVRSGRSDAEVQQSLATADLFVQPSRYEGSSLTTLEAMAHSRLVVGTAVGGIPDKVQDGRTGFLAPAATVSDISDAVMRALAADGSAIGAAARRAIDQRFSESAAAASYDSLYRGLQSVTG